MKKAACLTLFGVMLIGTAAVNAQTSPRVGLRAGVGTDINLGLAYGAGGNFLLTFPKNPNSSLELGVVFFGGSFDETTEESHTYEETTDIFVFGAMANYLIGYQPKQAGPFFIAGIGLASINVEWEERSSTDESLGPLLPGGGSMQSEEGSAAGTVFNLGVGQSFTGGLDIRLEIPVILAFSAPGEANAVIPTVIATAGFRF
ncbi:MAG: outer membrane beta-barrel protein [Candidatus Zixiibacteriota bacterium]|nr:MAG: outer membrane beta-barrel protein [candidate division Zixibacteria bacterium]